MARRHFLVTYRPLKSTAAGRTSAMQFGIPPFVDGSCRREPDFESRYPSISALCRKGRFAPRLQVGDRVAYLTVKGSYAGAHGWAAVAHLEIIERFESHAAAAEWYIAHGLALPNNCLITGNPPHPLEHTSRKMPPGARAALRRSGDASRAVRLWDASYKLRVREYPVFLATRPLYVNTRTPRVLSERDLRHIFGRLPGTRTPPEIDAGEFALLRRFVRGPT